MCSEHELVLCGPDSCGGKFPVKICRLIIMCQLMITFLCVDNGHNKVDCECHVLKCLLPDLSCLEKSLDLHCQPGDWLLLKTGSAASAVPFLWCYIITWTSGNGKDSMLRTVDIIAAAEALSSDIGNASWGWSRSWLEFASLAFVTGLAQADTCHVSHME